MTFGVELEPGTYFSSPPFEIPFTFEVDEPGWVAGHLIDEFFDVQRFEGEPGVGLPVRMVGFAHPDTFGGSDGHIPASELSAREAIDLLAARDSLVATNVRNTTILGREGAQIDLHSDLNNNPLFGGEDGNFGLGPELDVRLAVIEIDGGDLLGLLVLAPPGELEAAWTESRAILESIDIEP